MNLQDLYHFYGEDLTTDNTGDLALASGTTYTQQRILRRLLTNPATDTLPGDYVFHPDYGAGLPRFIGQPIDVAKIRALVLGQVLMEETVSKTPLPVVAVTQLPSNLSAFSISITYTDATTGSPTVLTFSVSA